MILFAYIIFFAKMDCKQEKVLNLFPYAVRKFLALIFTNRQTKTIISM